MNDSPDDRARDGAFQGADTASRPIPTPPVAAPAARTAPPRRSGARRFIAWWLVLSLLMVVACVAGLTIGLGYLDGAPMHIIIDGDDVTGSVSLDDASTGVKILVALGVMALAMLVLVLVPVVLLLVLGVVAIALVAGLGMPIVAMALALAVVSSPIWLVALLVWVLARRRHQRSATIAA